MTLLYPKTRDEWLKIRHEYVSSTESSALFGLNSYLTAFELAVIKKSDTPPTDDPDERMSWGLRLQRAIAEGIAEDYGVKVRQLNAYSTHADTKMGASFDFEIVGLKDEWKGENENLRSLYKQHGAGVLEIKNVDGWIFKQQWEQIEKAYEAPPHIEIQVQHQLECIGRQWAAIGILVGGNRQIVIARMRDRDVGGAIRAKVRGFFENLVRGVLPPVSLPQDSDAIRRLYRYAEPGKVLDFQKEENAALRKLIAAHQEAVQLKSAADKHHKATSAELIMAIGDAEKVVFPDCTVSAAMVAPARVEAYDRAGYRNLRVYAKTVKPTKQTKESA
jgi:predicted phage-related endonuclease